MQEIHREQDIVNSKTDASLRHNIINHYKPYIINIVGHVCKRFITWSDDEASIGLLAFNRAIDTFDPEGGRLFVSYAYLLMQRGLIDYFRRNKKFVHLSIHYSAKEEYETSVNELKTSMTYYQEEMYNNNLMEEILELDEQLDHFSIGFEELEESSPKHKDTRLSLHRMVFDFMQHDDLKQELLKKRRFPMTTFSQREGHSIKTMERYRKYLITLILIKLHPEWVHLSSYIYFEMGKGA